MADECLRPRIMQRTAGRALFIARDGKCYISRKYDIFSSDDWGDTWRLDCRILEPNWKSWAINSQMLTRLLRHYIQAFQVLNDGSRIAVARDGVYRAEPGETVLRRTFKVTRGSRPLNLCVDGSRLIFGEYGDSFRNLEVFLYVSEDEGRTWQVGYRFPRGDIRHVHNVLFDAQEDHYWVFVGDFQQQPGIGALSKDLKHIVWLIRGTQEARAVGAILTPDFLIYGMDSDYERNFIVRLEKQTGKTTKLLEVEGSSLYAGSFADMQIISTCVEPNPTSPSHECALYVSRDGDCWRRMLPHRKDRLPMAMFQFGCLVLPYSNYDKPRGMFSGQAVVGAHDRTTLLDFE